jgi:hypothetical protein
MQRDDTWRLHLLGDPEMQVWTNTPQTLQAAVSCPKKPLQLLTNFTLFCPATTLHCSLCPTWPLHFRAKVRFFFKFCTFARQIETETGSAEEQPVRDKFDLYGIYAESCLILGNSFLHICR